MEVAPASLSWTLLTPGNAAVILRSRLKVRVVKEPRDKKTAIHNGLSENGLDTEGGKQAMQYQVCGKFPSCLTSTPKEGTRVG